MLSMIGMSCYVLADTLFISNGVGLNGLAALNLTLPVYNLIFGLGALIGVGGATRFSILNVQDKELIYSPHCATTSSLASKRFHHPIKIPYTH